MTRPKLLAHPMTRMGLIALLPVIGLTLFLLAMKGMQ